MPFLERDSLEAIVMAQWAQVLGVPPDGLDEDFFDDAGGDSFRALALLERLRSVLEQPVPAQLLFEAPSVRGLASALRDGNEGTARRCVTFRHDGPGVPLVVVPNVAGNLVGFGRLADDLFARPVYALQSRGFATSEAMPLRSTEDIVTDLADELEKFTDHRVCHLAGLCVGGIFAYELAWLLSQRGWTVRSILLLNTTLEEDDAPYEVVLEERVGQLAGMAGVELPNHEEPSLRTLFELVRASGVDIVEDGYDEFARRTHVFVSNWYAATRYQAVPRDFPVTLFSTPDRLDGPPDGGDVRPDWTGLALPDLTVVDVDSAHHELLSDSGALKLIEDVLRSRDRAAQRANVS